jgi:hypothetical protein
MLARLHSVTLEGIEGVICEVEVDVARGGSVESHLRFGKRYIRRSYQEAMRTIWCAFMRPNTGN